MKNSSIPVIHIQHFTESMTPQDVAGAELGKATIGPVGMSSSPLLSLTIWPNSVRHQRRKLSPLAALMTTVLFLTSCRTPVPNLSTPQSHIDCSQAKTWETWLTKEATNPPPFCTAGKDPENAMAVSPWCQISSKRADLQNQYMAWRKMRLSSVPAPKFKAIQPKWGKNGVTNLAQLHQAPLSALIKGFRKTTRSHLQLLTQSAEKSTECSAALFLALASAWENFLPKADPVEIAQLYARSADCNPNADDSANIRFRAGLFYYSTNQWALASEQFEKSLNTAGNFGNRPRTYFWMYRTYLKLGQNSKAESAIDSLERLHPTSFHRLMGLRLSGRAHVVSESSGGYKTRGKNPLLNDILGAAEGLLSCSSPSGSLVLTNWAIGLLPAEDEPRLALYVAKLRDTAGEHPTKIALTADAFVKIPDLVNRETLELFYPRPFSDHFFTSKIIDPYFLMAIARQESAFDPNAVSSAKAMGLLQLIPHTARRFKSKVNLKNPKENIEVGARYISSLLKSLDGKVHFALASYNAGPLRLKEWALRYKTTDPILFIDLIPYRETRDYVASVLKNYFWYRELYAKNTETSSIVTGAFPADALALNELHHFDLTPTQAPPAVVPPIASAPVVKMPKPQIKVEQVSPEPKSEVAKTEQSKPESSEPTKKSKPEVESEITELADKKDLPDLKEKMGPEPISSKEKEDADAELPGEISVAPEIDRGLPK